MHPKYVGGVHRQGAVYIDLDAGNVAAGVQLVQSVDDLLRAPDGKGGDDHLAALASRFVHDIAQFFACVGVILVQPVTIGGFHDDDIGFGKCLGGGQDGAAGAANVAAEDDPPLFACAEFAHIDLYGGSAQDMAGLEEGNLDAIGDRHLALETDADKLVEARLHILLRVQRLHWRQTVALALLVDILNILLLDVAAVHEHKGAEVARGKRAPDVAAIALFRQIGNIPAVVDVGVAQDHCIDRRRVERKIEVALVGFGAPPLEETTFEQHAPIVDLNQVHRTGHFSSRTQKSDPHSSYIPYGAAPVVRAAVLSERGSNGFCHSSCYSLCIL